jgi:hypothetical protein
MKLRMTCTGTRPLLMHNVRLASPLDPYAKRLKALNSKKVKRVFEVNRGGVLG